MERKRDCFRSHNQRTRARSVSREYRKHNQSSHSRKQSQAKKRRTNHDKYNYEKKEDKKCNHYNIKKNKQSIMIQLNAAKNINSKKNIFNTKVAVQNKQYFFKVSNWKNITQKILNKCRQPAITLKGHKKLYKYPDGRKYQIRNKLQLIKSLKKTTAHQVQMKNMLNDLLTAKGEFNENRYPFEFMFGKEIFMRGYSLPDPSLQLFYGGTNSQKMLACYFNKNANCLLYDFGKIIFNTFIWQIKIYHTVKTKRKIQNFELLTGLHLWAPALQDERDIIVMSNNGFKYLMSTQTCLDQNTDLLKVKAEEVLISSYTNCFRTPIKDNYIANNGEGSNIITIFGMKNPIEQQQKRMLQSKS